MSKRGTISVTTRGATIEDRRGEIHAFAWSAVERIRSYKIDLITTDDVCLEFVADGQSYVVDEETDGWADLVAHIVQRFHLVTSWFANTTQPPFATNMSVLWDQTIQHALGRLDSARTDELWRLSRSDLTEDGTLRDIYIKNTTEADWNNMLAIARGMFGPVTVLARSRQLKHDLTAKHFGGKHRAEVRFSIGATEITGYCFNSSEIEMSFLPQQLQSSADLTRLLQFLISVTCFLKRPAFITPENAPDLPILQIEPTGDVQLTSSHAA